ncbi:MAG TPA: hypothetical protein VK936_02330 [Longimicrobiales bacterium]|nr:hypothetical protein [Longimicrobiales bacterium]
MRRGLMIAAVALALAACSGGGTDEPGALRTDTITQGARDSAVARSGLPGAAAVGRAQDAAATARERAAGMDSIR